MLSDSLTPSYFSVTLFFMARGRRNRRAQRRASHRGANVNYSLPRRSFDYRPVRPFRRPRPTFSSRKVYRHAPQLRSWSSSTLGQPRHQLFSVGSPRSFNRLEFRQVALPHKVRECLRRSTRREVLFATGSGGRKGPQAPHRQRSNVRC